MGYPDEEEQAELQEDHLAGDHYGAPHPDCWMCWDDDDEPEAPGFH